MNTIYVKTKKGMDEIIQRKPSIDLALNSVLVLIDGRRNAAELDALILRAKAPADSLQLLLHGGFIEPRVVQVQPARPSMDALQARNAQLQKEQQAQQERADAPRTAAQDATTTVFLETYTHLVGVTKKRLGLRGLPFQFKLERASTIDDLRSLVGPMSELVAKVQGLNAANEFVNETKQMMDDSTVREESMRMVAEAKAVDERKKTGLRRVA
jgi:hypothetical protein